ncbi:MAG: hypothetical protein B7C24_04505 [Bacteroidetes bacterium 4572_77]|nr:MAG: hypothetical protein B7C24_04505 [Bacteroidetes bacterium 4572_77]
MDVLKKYKISFSGLALGHHRFDFRIDDKFFERFENSRIKKADVALKVDMLKQENMLQLEFGFHGYVMVTCDRCLGEYAHAVAFNEVLMVKFGSHGLQEAEDVLVINANDYELSIAQHIYEYISLSLPMQLIHPSNEDGSSGCDSRFLENFEVQIEEDEIKNMDPRWDALKKLIKE